MLPVHIIVFLLHSCTHSDLPGHLLQGRYSGHSFFISSSRRVYEAGTWIILSYKGGTQDSEKLSRLAGVRPLVNGRVRIKAQLSLVPTPALSLSVPVLRRGPGRRGSIIGGGGKWKSSWCTHRRVCPGHRANRGPQGRENSHGSLMVERSGAPGMALALNFFLRD